MTDCASRECLVVMVVVLQVLGHDIGRIRGIINSVWADTAPEKRPILVGPDTAVDVSWDSAFLEVRHASCVCSAKRRVAYPDGCVPA